jgi:hypothetical protein
MGPERVKQNGHKTALVKGIGLDLELGQGYEMVLEKLNERESSAFFRVQHEEHLLLDVTKMPLQVEIDDAPSSGSSSVIK